MEIKRLSSFPLFLLALSFLSILVLNFLTPIYGTTDDFILDSWINGTYTGEFERNSIFITAIGSNFLSTLQSLVPSFPWYSIFLLTLNIFSIATIFQILIKSKSIDYRFKIYLAVITLTYFIWSILRITYTSTSIILATTSVICLFVYLRQKQNIYYFSCLIYFILAFAIRPEGLIIVFLIIWPILFFERKELKFYWKKIIGIIILMGLLFFTNFLIQNIESQDFAQYRIWAKKVQSFAGRPRMIEITKDIGASKWTVSEYHLFSDLAYFDKKVFNVDWINKGIKSTNSVYFKPDLTFKNILKIFNKLVNSWSYFNYILIGFLFISIFFRNKKLILYYFNFIFIHFLLGLFLHNVSRVSIPIVLTLIFGSIFLLNFKNTVRMFNFFNIIFFLFLFYLTFNLNTENINKVNDSKTLSDYIAQNLSENIVLIHGNQEFNQNQNPYSLNKRDNNPNIFMVGNWDTFSPHWYKRANNLGISGENLIAELLTNKVIVWTAPTYPETTFHLKNYLKEKGFGQIEPTRIDLLPNGNDVWSFSIKE